MVNRDYPVRNDIGFCSQFTNTVYLLVLSPLVVPSLLAVELVFFLSMDGQRIPLLSTTSSRATAALQALAPKRELSRAMGQVTLSGRINVSTSLPSLAHQPSTNTFLSDPLSELVVPSPSTTTSRPGQR